MKVLLDSCVSGTARLALEAAGHDVEWSADWDTDPGDREILERAHLAGRVLITIDKDFGELAIVHGSPHAGIVRLVGLRAARQGPVAAEALDRFGDVLERGGLVTADPGRFRIRPPDSDEQTQP